MMLHLCNSHPDVALTLELGSLRTLWVPPRLYALALLEGWRATPVPILQFSGSTRRGWSERWRSLLFIFGFLSNLRNYRHRLVGPNEVAACYRRQFPGRKVVGDKLPAYSLSLDQFAHVQGVRCVVIYRHVFSVVSSYMRAVNNRWRRIPALSRLDTHELVAQQWVDAMAQLERHQHQVLALCYERMLTDPQSSLEALGHWLDVHPSGFRRDILRQPKSPVRFESEVEARILDIASATLEKLGYPKFPEMR